MNDREKEMARRSQRLQVRAMKGKPTSSSATVQQISYDEGIIIVPPAPPRRVISRRVK